MFIHLRGRLRCKEMVPCSFGACKFQTNVYSTFNAHKCREHQNTSDYDASVVVLNVSNISRDSDLELHDATQFSDENKATPEEESSTEGLALSGCLLFKNANHSTCITEGNTGNH